MPDRLERGLRDLDVGAAVREFVACVGRFESGEWRAEAVAAAVPKP